ncbi:MAG: glycosyltransferase [Dehalococcoidia bacterium]
MTPRKTVLLAMYDGGGNVPALLAIAEELLKREHRVIVLAGPFFGETGPSPSLVERARALGCDVHELEIDESRAPDVPPQRGLFAGRTGRWFGPLQYTYSIYRDAWRWAEVAAELCAAERVDVVAADDMLPGALVGAESAGVPSCSLMHTVYFFRPAKGLPPPGMGLDPPSNFGHRVRDRLLARVMSRVYRRDGLPGLNAARDRVGLQPIAHPWDQHARAKKVIVLTSRHFDFVAESLPANVEYSGMPFASEPAGDALSSSPKGPPIVLVGLSTSSLEQTATAQAALDALAPLPVRSIITMTGSLTPGALRLPANAEAFGFLPHSQVMPRVTAVVTHGGHGTVLTALKHGKPLVCVPIYFDQSDIARRVQRRGIGIDVGRRHTAPAIRAAVQRVLSEPAFATNARGIAQRIASERGAEHAASIIEREAGMLPAMNTRLPEADVAAR